jgi:hypothetical protein
MKIPVILLAIAALCCTTLVVSAQSMGSDYQTAVGVKFGWWSGAAIDAKHFIKDNVAIEGEVSFYNYGAEVNGLYEWYGHFASVEGLKWYIGAGGHIGGYNHTYAQNYPSRSSGVFFGPDGILGVDYKFTGAPINISFDIQPLFDVPGMYFNVWGGLGVRFAF